MDMQHHFRFFGKKCRDRVTGFEGVGSSICFDLYGCVQTALCPPAVKDAPEQPKSCWYDNNRLICLDDTPVMDLPKFMSEPIARDQPGGFVKDVPSR